MRYAVLVSIDVFNHRTTNLFDSNGRQNATLDYIAYRTTTIFDTRSRVAATQDDAHTTTDAIPDYAGPE